MSVDVVGGLAARGCCIPVNVIGEWSGDGTCVWAGVVEGGSDVPPFLKRRCQQWIRDEIRVCKNVGHLLMESCCAGARVEPLFFGRARG